MTLKKEYKGFTLIELMVVMAIIAVLSTLIIGAVQLARSTATETTHRSNARNLQTALESNYAKYREYCSTTSAAGELSCTSATQSAKKSYSFQAAKDAGLAIELSTGVSTASTCSTGQGNEGGGNLQVYPNGYVLTPRSSDCASDLAKDILQINP